MDSKMKKKIHRSFEASFLLSVILLISSCDPNRFKPCDTKLEFVLDNKVENLKPVYSLGDTITIKGLFSDTLVDRITQRKVDIQRPYYYYDIGCSRLDTLGGFSDFKDIKPIPVIGNLIRFDLSDPDGHMYGDAGGYRVETTRIGSMHQLEFKIVLIKKGIFAIYFDPSLFFYRIEYDYIPSCDDTAEMFCNTNNSLNNRWETYESLGPYNGFAVANVTKKVFDDLGVIVFEVK